MKWGFKRKRGLMRAFGLLGHGLGGGWMKGKIVDWWLNELKKKKGKFGIVVEWGERGLRRSMEKLHLVKTLTDRLDGQTTSVSAQILRRCSTQRDVQSSDGQS